MRPSSAPISSSADGTPSRAPETASGPEAQSPTDAGGREDPGDRAHRELIELLNELRVALPGVQVLFAFLLTVPFSQGFDQLGPNDRRVYFAAVVATALATVFLVAPTAHHRLRFRSGTKEQILKVSNVLAIVGLSMLAFAMSAVVYVISNVLYETAFARIATALLAAAMGIIWFVVPFAYSSTERTPPAHDKG